MDYFLFTAMDYTNNVEKIKKFSIQSSFLFSNFAGIVLCLSILMNVCNYKNYRFR